MKIIDFSFDDEEDKNSEQKRQTEGSIKKVKVLSEMKSILFQHKSSSS